MQVATSLRSCLAACFVLLTIGRGAAPAEIHGSAGAIPQAAESGAPQWFPLPPAEQKHLDEVLDFWEFQSNQIQTYSCQFERWEYDGHDSRQPNTYSTGELKYATPDKGLFRVRKSQQRVRAPGRAPSYTPLRDVEAEHWVCDGKSIIEFDARQKLVKQRILPAQMQGNAIVDGPLPFLFGAKANRIKQRYWIRVVRPTPEPGKFWLEAVPRRQEDAANARMIEIVIDEEQFLPERLALYHRDDSSTRFRFTNRQVNKHAGLGGLFRGAFWKPAPPSGWKLVVEDPQR